MRFFSRRRAFVDARRRQVRPALELLESRIVPSSEKVVRVYPLEDLVVPIAQGPATSGLQGYGGGLGTFGQNPFLTPPPPSVAQSWWTTLQGDLKSLTTTLAGDIQSAGQWVSSTVDSFFALFSHPQLLPPPQLLQVPSSFYGGGGLGGFGNLGSGLYQDNVNFINLGTTYIDQETTTLLNLIKQVVAKPYDWEPGGFGTQSLQVPSQGSLNGE
jgi:hypothetical protein